jgi:hypothetical protein
MAMMTMSRKNRKHKLPRRRRQLLHAGQLAQQLIGRHRRNRIDFLAVEHRHTARRLAGANDTLAHGGGEHATGFSVGS